MCWINKRITFNITLILLPWLLITAWRPYELKQGSAEKEKQRAEVRHCGKEFQHFEFNSKLLFAYFITH